VKREQADFGTWEDWMRGMGRYTRRLRELVGLSQEQLARLAGVSQGAVSRMEGGRAVNTPMIVVMRVNHAMREALARLPPRLLSEESSRLMNVPGRGIPGDAAAFETLPVAADAELAEIVRLFWGVAPRQRPQLTALVRLAADMLAGSEAGGRARRRPAR
jgi:transcriptional regulator with XRE-family HTH domain